MTVSDATKFLEMAYGVFNKMYFDNALPKVIITIQSSPCDYGHCTVYNVWAGKKKGFREINISAETLDRPIAKVVATLLHEMVHLYCLENDIKDTSRGYTYHNKRFRDEAVKRGLLISYDKTIGWSITEPTKELRSFVVKQHWVNKLSIHRRGEPMDDEKAPKVRKPSSTRKYLCPSCGLSVRATKDVLLLCGVCMEILQKES